MNITVDRKTCMMNNNEHSGMMYRMGKMESGKMTQTCSAASGHGYRVPNPPFSPCLKVFNIT